MVKPKLTKGILMITLLFLAYAISTGFVVNAVSSNDNWPMFHHDPTHTGYSTSTPTATSATLLWNYTTQGGVSSSPAIADGFVYVGGWDNNDIYCLNALTGSEIWVFTTQGHINSSPAVAAGIVYVGSWDHKVYAFGIQPTETSSPSFLFSPESTYLIVIAISIAVIIAAIFILRLRKK